MSDPKIVSREEFDHQRAASDRLLEIIQRDGVKLDLKGADMYLVGATIEALRDAGYTVFHK